MAGGLDRTTNTGDSGQDNQIRPDLSKELPWRPQIASTTPSDAATTAQGNAQTTDQETFVRAGQQWRAGYGQVAPAFTNNMGNMGYGDQTQTQQAQQQQSQQPWRAGYNGVAPAYDQGQQQQQQQQPQNGAWRPSYGTTPTDSSPTTGQQPYNPNANGDQSAGPQWTGAGKPVVTWNQPQPYSPQATGQQPGQPGQIARPGGRGPQGPNDLYDPHRSDLDDNIGRYSGFPGNMIVGGLAGVAAGGPIPWILNRTADSILLSPEARAASRTPVIAENGLGAKVMPEAWRTNINEMGQKFDAKLGSIRPGEGSLGESWAKSWQRNFDPRYARTNELVLQQNQFANLDQQLTALKDANQAKLTELTTKYPDLATTPPEVNTQLRNLELRNNIFEKLTPRSAGPAELGEARGALSANPNLLTTDEMKLLSDRQTASAAAMSAEGKIPNTKFMGERPLGNFLTGAAFVGLEMVAENYADRLLNNKDHHQGLSDSALTNAIPVVGPMTNSWHTDTLLVPMALSGMGALEGKGAFAKAGIMGAAALGTAFAGSFLDKMIPANEHQGFSRLFQENSVDSALMGAAFLLPANSFKVRAGLVAGAWALGRVTNFFEGPTKLDAKNEGFDDMKKDMSDRSSGSMNSAIDKFKELGTKDDYALKLYTSDWLRPGRQYDGMMSAYRGAVILCDAWGESRTEKGTLIPQTTDQFVPGTQGIDVGGQATRAFIIAQTNLDRAKQQAQSEMGKQDHGKTVDQSEIDGLNEVQKRINAGLAQIYGKHDVSKAVDGIAGLYHDNAKGAALLLIDVNNSLALNRNSTNKQFVAKLFRDYATIELGDAQYNAQKDPTQAMNALYGTDQGRQFMFNNGQPRGFDGVMDAIALAKQFDPTSPDLPELEALAAKIGKDLPQNKQNQMSNPIYNPLNVNDQLHSKR